MAAEIKTGMDKGEMKKLLMKSKKEPVNCAFAQGEGKSAAFALLLLDRIKQPKAVSKDLEKQFPEAKNPRWGTAFVDVDDNPKLVKFTINKPISGAAKKLVKTLKGTGFTKVHILLEDGSAVEMEEEEEEGAPVAAGAEAEDAPTPQPAAAEQTDGAPPPAAAAAPDGPATPPAAPAEANGQPDAPATSGDLAALTKRMTDLVKRMGHADPADLPRLKGFAYDAQAAIKSGDPRAANMAVDALQTALDQGPPQDASASGPAPGAAPSQPAAATNGAANGAKSPGAAPAYAKAKLAWGATRKKLEADLGKLQSAIQAAYDGHGAADDLDKAFTSKIEPMLESLDEELSEKLDAVSSNTDASRHDALMADVKATVARYEQYIAGEPLIAKLDTNPFVPIQLQKTVEATLAVIRNLR